jgi:hypothetical protein
MDDIRRQDLRLFLRELVDPMRLFATGGGLILVLIFTRRSQSLSAFLLGASVILLCLAATAWSASERKRFYEKRMQALWHGCNDRLVRLEEVLKKMRRDQIADLREMPKTIRAVAKSLYFALRRADIIAHEVQASERGVISQPPSWNSASNDPQSRELYRLADKNIAEYRAQYSGVMAGVQRTEAQSAVFITTLDTLRMKIIGYRLVGRSPELASHEFLEALAEARAQLQSIDTALDELDLGHYPKVISVVQPPPIPDEIQEQIRERL